VVNGDADYEKHKKNGDNPAAQIAFSGCARHDTLLFTKENAASDRFVP
jgi:hypothetical protein